LFGRPAASIWPELENRSAFRADSSQETIAGPPFTIPLTRRKIMNKSLLAASLFAVALTACGKKDETPAPAPVTAPVPAPAPMAAPDSSAMSSGMSNSTMSSDTSSTSSGK
jgi:hypothetical protein